MSFLAETPFSFESIAYLLAMAAVLFFQQRAAAQAKIAAELLVSQAKTAEKAKADIEAIKATTEDTAKTVVTVKHLTDGQHGMSLRAVAVSARLLAEYTKSPEHIQTAVEAETALLEHTKREAEAARALAERSTAVAVANATANPEPEKKP